MDPEAYVKAVGRRARAERWHVTVETVDGRDSIMAFPLGSTALEQVDPRPMVVSARDPGTLTRAALDQFAAAARTAAKSVQGRWGVTKTLSVTGGWMTFMPVVVTSGAPEEALEWASKRHGLAFPVLVDVGAGTLTRWKHAVIGAVDAARFVAMVEDLLRPVLVGEGPGG
ncbi:hypothetical protein K6U06_09975 [Acidiferrimicrobium sp. IK]|uniref:hypothetical protein n=1 Tax=Acidiferrimicrobium sp. IK TaxID=2871700 RepID=UPI0021CB025B|nr:hypothetical protein [Acidiferrimicrobium sp. IK]MCU4184687.1 hypothetical protein [Acidiferrimicrobium sp. IK]